MVTQEPTLHIIDTTHNQFQIVFGVQMIPGEAILDVTVPNLRGMNADVYSIDFLKVNTPARGNFPSIRCIEFVLETTQESAGEVQVGNIYLVNPQSAQVLALLAPTPGPGFSSLVFGCVPFFAKSNQSIQLMRAPSINCIATLSATAYTYDLSSFLTSMIPAPTLYNNGSPAIPLDVLITNTVPLDVNIASPIPLPTTP
jgi:hypothetical protein